MPSTRRVPAIVSTAPSSPASPPVTIRSRQARFANAAAALATMGYGAVAPLPHVADVERLLPPSAAMTIAQTFCNDMLAGKVALVVAASSGIGAAIARGLADAGAVVTVTGATPEEAAAARAAARFRRPRRDRARRA
jgi:3-oxoacyl-ACP reductase-like protein